MYGPLRKTIFHSFLIVAVPAVLDSTGPKFGLVYPVVGPHGMKPAIGASRPVRPRAPQVHLALPRLLGDPSISQLDLRG